MNDCIFCKIANKEIPSEILFENDKILAFKDITPVAPFHVLIIPKEHITSIDHIEIEHKELLGDIMFEVKNLAYKLGISKDGYRLVNNCGNDGGQTVSHIHFHLIAGRQMQWPPG